MKGERGFIGTVVLIVVVIFVVSYYGFDLREIIESPETKQNFLYTREWIVYIWKNFIVEPFSIAWHYLVLFLKFLKSIKGT